MIKKIKLPIILLPLLFTAFYSGGKGLPVEYYNSLTSLKVSSAPREVKMIRTDNLEKGKSILEKGILITYKNRYAVKVEIAGDFTDWQTAAMTRSKYGIWYYFLNGAGEEGITRYKFRVDGIWLPDPMNSGKDDDRTGSYVSLLHPLRDSSTQGLTFRFIGSDEVEFRLYKPEARFISIVGDFNNWNPENDLLEKDTNGVWSLRKKLLPGQYKYKYIIDGEWTLDLYNEMTAGDAAEGTCSLLKVQR